MKSLFRTISIFLIWSIFLGNFAFAFDEQDYAIKTTLSAQISINSITLKNYYFLYYQDIQKSKFLKDGIPVKKQGVVIDDIEKRNDLYAKVLLAPFAILSKGLELSLSFFYLVSAYPSIVQKIKNNFNKKIRILDIGTGNGVFIESFQRILKMNNIKADIVGIDSNPSVFHRIKNRSLNIKIVDVQKADNFYKKLSFDMIFINAPENDHRTEKIIEHAMKFLSPEGFLVLRLPSGVYYEVNFPENYAQVLKDKLSERFDVDLLNNHFSDLPTGSYYHLKKPIVIRHKSKSPSQLFKNGKTAVYYFACGSDLEGAIEVIDNDNSIDTVYMVDKDIVKLNALRQIIKDDYIYEEIANNEFVVSINGKSIKIILKQNNFKDTDIETKHEKGIYIVKLPGKNGELSFNSSYFYSFLIKKLNKGDLIYIKNARMFARFFDPELFGLEKITNEFIAESSIINDTREINLSKKKWVDSNGWMIYRKVNEDFSFEEVYVLLEIDELLYSLSHISNNDKDKEFTYRFLKLAKKEMLEVLKKQVYQLFANAPKIVLKILGNENSKQKLKELFSRLEINIEDILLNSSVLIKEMFNKKGTYNFNHLTLIQQAI